MAEATTPGPQLAIDRIYLRDASFESPRAPDVFLTPWKPKVQLDINTKSSRLDDNRFEVILTVTCTARSGTEAEPDILASGGDQEDEGPVGLIVEIQQAGIFRLDNMNEAAQQQVLAINCAHILFPYAKETLESLTVKGTFPPFNLAPVNFEALFVEAVRQQQAGQPPGDVVN